MAIHGIPKEANLPHNLSLVEGNQVGVECGPMTHVL
jgi:hypothetical protein